jgi:hypothetical protein
MDARSEILIPILQIVVPLISGGLAGAAFTSWRQRQNSQTALIPIIERINRNPLQYELKGIKLIRMSGPGLSSGVEVTGLRHYQFTLRNTSRHHLRDSEIQFEFPASDVESWVSRPSLSRTPLMAIAAEPVPPWLKALRWRIPQLPPGDSIEFGFQAIDPSSEHYEIALFSAANVIVRATKEEPAEKPPRLSGPAFLVVLAISVGIGVLLTNVFLTSRQSIVDGVATAFLKGDRLLLDAPADEAAVRTVVKESQIEEMLNLYENPDQSDGSNLLSKYWVPGGEAVGDVQSGLRTLAKSGLHYGPESSAKRLEILSAKVFVGDRAEVKTTEQWFLPLYTKDGKRVSDRNPEIGPIEVNYALRKVNGKWLIQSSTTPYVRRQN